MLAVINIIGFYLLPPVVKRELNGFLAHVRTCPYPRIRPGGGGRRRAAAGEVRRLTAGDRIPVGARPHLAPWCGRARPVHRAGRVRGPAAGMADAEDFRREDHRLR